jgi:CBS domain containing-hemolysin-like protein
LHIKDLYRIIDTQKEKETLAQSNIIRDILFVPTIKPADEVLYLMRKKKIHIAVVTDERERTAGIVTLEDIIERIIGNIEDEFDYTTKEIEELKDGSYIVSGLYSIDKLKRKFNFPLKGQGYTSVGALVASLLGRTPKRGDIIEIGNIKMKVAEVEGKRVSYLYVTVKK